MDGALARFEKMLRYNTEGRGFESDLGLRFFCVPKGGVTKTKTQKRRPETLWTKTKTPLTKTTDATR